MPGEPVKSESLLARPFEGSYPVTQPFGPTSLESEPRLYGFDHFHTGVDYALPMGTPVLASGDGHVYKVGLDSTGYGRRVVVDHGGGLFTLYAHLSYTAVVLGAAVRRGQMIGRSGNTGNSTGPHLHWSVIFDGLYTHPWPWVSVYPL